MDILVYDKVSGDALRQNYGSYSALDPVATPDGKTMLPSRCLSDNDLVDAHALMTSSTEGESEIGPLPAFGEECVADILYLDTTVRAIDETGSNVLKCVQTHNRTEHDPKTIPALFTFFRENADDLDWIENEYVYVGWMRMFGGTQYEVIQEHMTLSTWTPPVVPALWSEVIAPSSDWQAGVSVSIGEQYDYLGITYEVLQAHTTQIGWEPPNVPALWSVV